MKPSDRCFLVCMDMYSHGYVLASLVRLLLSNYLYFKNWENGKGKNRMKIGIESHNTVA